MAGPDTNFLFGTAKPGPYKTQLPMVEEMAFQDWVRRNNIPFKDGPQSDYDMRGYWKKQQASVTPDIPRNGPFTAGTHFNDEFKTPYHETFSNESKYGTSGANHWRNQNPQSDDGAWKLFNPVGGLVKDESPPPAAAAPDPATPTTAPRFGYKRKLEQP